jgi:DoxX-like family
MIMNKTKKIAAIAMTVIVSLMVTMSGIMKLSQSEEVMQALGKIGITNYVVLLGVMEVVFTALFIYSKTMRLGFILLCCYFAGAIATDLSHGTPIINATMIMVFIWIAAFLREPFIFLPSEWAKN